ncbi:actin-histidine N-methyltransferase-like [Schistocerca gregaria]|uniref:actin-histidine N-methyltransferase-like n=1 Tax=Schistocerca gregaria TaxID=7010 RepID=UPI00211EB580|nr:actin-histidine N-methyltransferase-like [Schistocerca gregaria]
MLSASAYKQKELEKARQQHEELVRQTIEKVNGLAIALNDNTDNNLVWPKFVEMYNELQTLREIQSPHFKLINSSHASKPAGDSASGTTLENLVRWLKKNGAKIDDSVAQLSSETDDASRHSTHQKLSSKESLISIFPASLIEGNGVFVNRPVNAGELLIQVPRSLMMTIELIQKYPQLKPITQDGLISQIPSIQLAVLLIYEKYLGHSFWEPYIASLPKKYSTIYYWSLEQIRKTKGSFLFEQAISVFCTTVKAYYETLMTILTHDIMPKNFYTYDTFIWALSAVYSRQTFIAKSSKCSPNPGYDSNERTTLALVPGYDMFNHAYGKNTSNYDSEADALQLFAMKNFERGEQAYMYYGPRSNSELLLYQGFVDCENPHDYTLFYTSIPETDPLFEKKQQLLKQLSFEFNHDGSITLPLFAHTLAPSSLLFFRVMVCNDESLLTLDTLSQSLDTKTTFLPKDSEKLALKMLSLKCQQLLNNAPKCCENVPDLKKVKKVDPIEYALTLFFITQKKIIESSLTLSLNASDAC